MSEVTRAEFEQFKQDIKNILSSHATHIERKVTDYQVYVDRAIEHVKMDELEQQEHDSAFANALKTVKTGKHIVSLDTSPLTHNIKVRLSSAEVISDYSDYYVTQHGKNLLKFTGSGIFKPLDDGTYEISNSFIGNKDFSRLYLPAGTYTLSALSKEHNPNDYENWFYVMSSNNKLLGRDYGEGCTFTITEPDKLKINMHCESGLLYNRNIRPMIEVGSIVTEYEGYREIRYIPDFRGNIDSIEHISPITNLIASDPKMFVAAEFNRDLNKVITEIEERLE